MAKKRNIIVGQSGGPTAEINSSLAGVYKNAIERGFDKVYGMLHGGQGLLDEQYVDLATQIHSELDIGCRPSFKAQRAMLLRVRLSNGLK